MLLVSYNHSFIVQASAITFVDYNYTVIMILNYEHRTFIVQATGLILIAAVCQWNYIFQILIAEVTLFFKKSDLDVAMGLSLTIMLVPNVIHLSSLLADDLGK
jgi:hypothetical protein